MASIAPIYGSWRSTSLLVCPALEKPMRILMADKNVTNMKLFNSFILALAKGDILIDEIELGDTKMTIGVGDTLESLLNVVFRDSKGNILKTDNPNKIEGGLI